MVDPHRLQGLTLAFCAGTGRMGSNLARLYALAGFRVIIGSRDPAKAQALAQQLRDQHPDSQLRVEGASNAEAAAAADVVHWCIMTGMDGSIDERLAALRSLQAELEGKIIVDITNLLYLPAFSDDSNWGQVSSVLMNQEALGVAARWTTAWKSTSWKLLEELPTSRHCTFVCGDDAEAVETVMALVEQIKPFKAINAGGLKNSRIVELLGPMWMVELDTLNCGGQGRSGWKWEIAEAFARNAAWAEDEGIVPPGMGAHAQLVQGLLGGAAVAALAAGGWGNEDDWGDEEGDDYDEQDDRFEEAGGLGEEDEEESEEEESEEEEEDDEGSEDASSGGE